MLRMSDDDNALLVVCASCRNVHKAYYVNTHHKHICKDCYDEVRKETE